MQTTRLASVPILILFAALTLYGQSNNLTTPEAKDHVGETATVCGRVVTARYIETSKGQSISLDLDGRYPRQPFTIVISNEDRQKFGDLESKYRDKNICVTAKITQHGEAPEAVVTNPEQIQAERASAVGLAQASSPQSQPAQSAVSAPPPPPQSQEQTGGSAPTHSLSPAESLIERARQAAFEFSEKLPHFICVEYMSRFSQQGREEETPIDVVSAEIIYVDGMETYRNVKINDSPTDKSLVRRENSHWVVQSRSQTLTPAYGGSVWIDPQTARVLRIEIQGRNIPSDFPMDTVESAVDYSYVMIGGASFLLPVHAESLGCERGTNYCSHNVIDFRSYHEFKVDSRILSPSK
jgi:hypothetical protein